MEKARIILLLSLIVSLIGAFEAVAITWEFEEEGDTQGWYARESFLSGTSSSSLSFLRSEVRDGFWRFDVLPFKSGRMPSVGLISPPIGHDSALFDRISIRLRVVHSRPIHGQFLWSWTNLINQTNPGREVDCGDRDPCYSRFQIQREVTYTTEWQEIVISDLRTGPDPSPFRPGAEILWEGELIDIRLDLMLGEQDVQGVFIGGPEDVPEAIEIDRIVLTGFEEQLQGELPPPSGETTTFGELFEPAVFNPLESGIGSPGFFLWRGAELGDIDGDGDLDLVAVRHSTSDPDTDGWLTARNDGTGHFYLLHSEALSGSGIVQLRGADLDGDGRMEVMKWESYERIQLLYYDKDVGEWWVRQEFRNLNPLGMGDADGDGDEDLFMGSLNEELHSTSLLLFLNDGSGYFDPAAPVRFALSEPSGPMLLVQPLGKGGAAGVLWGTASGSAVTHLNAEMEMIRDPLAILVDALLTRYVGDFDQDGDVDLIVSSGLSGGFFTGLTLLINSGDGTLESADWYENIAVSHYVEFFDLNGDGILDPVFVDSDERDPAVLVHLGQPNGLPVLEGRYPLQGRGKDVLSGDVDGDGDADLVILEPSGGAHVLRNRRADLSTAVVAGARRNLPASFDLGRNYPNPFNPQTWIPFSLSRASEAVRLQVFNALGQPIRTLLTGVRLDAGEHMISWDGKDDQGKSIPSGVYFYRLTAGGQSLSGKMVKAE